MQTGSKKTSLSPTQAMDRLVGAMAGGNFEILEKEPGKIIFRHGTCLTQTVSMLPKRGSITIEPDGDGAIVRFEVEACGFPKYWLMFFGILFFWLIFPPLIVYRALNYHPKKLMENLFQLF